MAHRLLPADAYSNLAAQALVEGGYDRPTLATIRWDLAANCEKPLCRTSHVRSEPTVSGVRLGGKSGYDYIPGEHNVWNVDYQLRCRRCEPCLRYRRSVWAVRARSETVGSVRSWFGTLTLAPEHHFQMLTRARYRLSQGGTEFETLSEAEQFSERHREISLELTKFLKRVRQSSRATLRVLLVAERHESGLPHYHALIHEYGMQPVRYRQLAGQWPLGHCMFKLIDPADLRACWYVTKYLAKSADARVRASLGYGNPPVPDFVRPCSDSASGDVGAKRSGGHREENKAPEKTSFFQTGLAT